MNREQEALAGGVNREQPTLVGVVNREQEKFHKRHLRGRGMLECVCVCMCKVSYRILSFGMGGDSKVRC